MHPRASARRIKIVYRKVAIRSFSRIEALSKIKSVKYKPPSIRSLLQNFTHLFVDFCRYSSGNNDKLFFSESLARDTEFQFDNTPDEAEDEMNEIVIYEN